MLQGRRYGRSCESWKNSLDKDWFRNVITTRTRSHPFAKPSFCKTTSPQIDLSAKAFFANLLFRVITHSRTLSVYLSAYPPICVFVDLLTCLFVQLRHYLSMCLYNYALRRLCICLCIVRQMYQSNSLRIPAYTNPTVR